MSHNSGTRDLKLSKFDRSRYWFVRFHTMRDIHSLRQMTRLMRWVSVPSVSVDEAVVLIDFFFGRNGRWMESVQVRRRKSREGCLR